jgi:uncharacterized membrane protein YhaH (DUF805 family)
MNEFFTTNGRFPRSKYWTFFIVFYVLGAIVGGISEKIHSDVVRVVIGLMFFPLMIVGIIVQVKRWHDRDKSGWWVLINFVPCIGWIWALVECGFLKGTTGPNQYGEDPVP